MSSTSWMSIRSSYFFLSVWLDLHFELTIENWAKNGYWYLKDVRALTLLRYEYEIELAHDCLRSYYHRVEKLNLSRATIDSLIFSAHSHRLTFFGRTKKSANSLKGTSSPLKNHAELMGILQAALKNLTTLWERYHEDNPDNKTSICKDVKPDGMA